MSNKLAKEFSEQLEGTTIVTDQNGTVIEYSFDDIKYKKLTDNYELSGKGIGSASGSFLNIPLTEGEVEQILNGDGIILSGVKIDDYDVNAIKIKEFQDQGDISKITVQQVDEIRDYFTTGPTEEEANQKYNILGIKPWILDEISEGDIAGKRSEEIAKIINEKIPVRAQMIKMISKSGVVIDQKGYSEEGIGIISKGEHFPGGIGENKLIYGAIVDSDNKILTLDKGNEIKIDAIVGSKYNNEDIFPAKVTKTGIVLDESKPESEEKINQPDYKYYVLNDKNKILKGFEYKEDAREFKKDQQEYGKMLTVSSKRDLKSQSIEPDNNSNWEEGNEDKEDIKKRMIKWYNTEIEELAYENIVKSITGNPEENNKDLDIIKGKLDNLSKEDIVIIATLYGDHLLDKAGCARKYNMPKTAAALMKEYKKLEMFL